MNKTAWDSAREGGRRVKREFSNTWKATPAAWEAGEGPARVRKRGAGWGGVRSQQRPGRRVWR